jgi:putative flippase GtrA
VSLKGDVVGRPSVLSADPVASNASVGLRRRLADTPLARRIFGYSAGSVIAAATSEASFVMVLGPLHGGTTWASAAGFIGGAVPNYILNRRWAWPDRRGRDRRTEIILYTVVALATFLASAVATHWAEAAARQVTDDGAWTVVLTAIAFLAVSGLFFVVKFVLYERVVFTPDGVEARSAGGRPGAGSTRS